MTKSRYFTEITKAAPRRYLPRASGRAEIAFDGGVVGGVVGRGFKLVLQA
jgi:hypothetical protein